MATQTTQSGIPGDQTLSPLNEEDDLQEGSDENGENNISRSEIDLLDNAGTNEPGDDDQLLNDSLLDDTDEDGDKLNEDDDLGGDDLDVPGSEADDEDELIGEEDEENNSYSISDQDDDDDDPVI
ncbi:MAG: hypothetical protein WKI04_13090 [Ferruginibacter sp.]